MKNKNTISSITVTRDLLAFVALAKSQARGGFNCFIYSGNALKVLAGSFNMIMKLDGEETEPLFISDKALSYVCSFAEGSTVKLSSDGDKVLTASCGRSKTRMPLLSSDSAYSPNDEPGNEGKLIVSPSQMSLLKKVAAAPVVMALGVRPAMSSVFIKTNSRGSAVAFATDGHKLAVADLKCEAVVDYKIDKGMFTRLLAFKPFKDGFTMVESKDKRKVILSCDGGISIAVPLVDCTVLDYEAILRLQNPSEITCNKEDLKKTIRRSIDLMGQTKAPYGKMSVLPDALCVRVKSEVFDGEDFFAITSQTPHTEVNIGINLTDLCIALNEVEEDDDGNIFIKYTGPLAPYMLYDSELIFLLMPVRLN